MERLNLRQQFEALYHDLSHMDSAANVSWQVGAVFNALLEDAKKVVPDNLVLSAVEPVFGESGWIGASSAGSLLIVVNQILVVL